MNPGHGRHQNASVAEHPLDDGEDPFYRGSLSIDAPVREPIPDTQRMAPHRTPHGGIVAPGLNAEVPLVTVDYLPWPGEVHPAVVHAGRRCLQLADEAEVRVGLRVRAPFLAQEPYLLLLVFASSPRGSSAGT